MDKTTFEQLYRDMLPGLYRLAQSMLRQTADAQDAVQQAAVSAWLSLERIRPGGERAYFTRIVINECRNIQRQRMRQTPRAPPQSASSHAPLGTEPRTQSQPARRSRMWDTLCCIHLRHT